MRGLSCHPGLARRRSAMVRAWTGQPCPRSWCPGRGRTLIAVGATILATLWAPAAHAQSATYRVTFEGKWTTTATAPGVAVPGGAHFSPLIGAVHNAQVTFWSSGGTASAGIESMAEVGGTSTLKTEITTAGSDASSTIERSGNIGATATVTVDITLSPSHPLVTLVTMIAPSPDWFVGVAGVSLLDAQNEWLASHAVDLFPYDAGTEDGTEFSLSNDATDPRGTITSITGTGKFSNAPIATLTFTRQTVAPVITTPAAIDVAENETAVATLSATDQDTDVNELTWSIPSGTAGGADGDDFTLTSAGVLTFTTAKDYETSDDTDGDNIYEVTVQVSDGANSTTADLTVTVADVAPGLAGPATASHAEGKRGLQIAAYTVNDAVTWSLTGADSTLFMIADGFLRFVDPPDFENADDATTDNVYNVTVQADDGTATETTAVAVTVTDGDEPGVVTLSPLKPKLDTALTATLADPDTVSGTPTWQWERNDGREGWEVIDGATAASYTLTAADGDRYLRATATYTDGFGSGKTAQATAPHVVIAHRLSGLTFTGLTGVSRDSRAFYPAFDQDTLHYAARCTESVTLTLTTENEGTRLSVNGVQSPKDEAFTVDSLGFESDIRITLTGTKGASTTYTVHCIDREEFPKLTTEKADGATEDLMMFRAKWRPSGVSRRSSLIMMDNNGVPRWRKHIGDNVNEYFRVFPDETHPRARYGYMKQGSSYNTDGVELVVLDKYFNTVAEDVHILSPFNNTDGHDQIILPNGDYVLMAYSRGQRDLSFLNTAFADLRNDGGGLLGTNEAVRDSAIQVRTSDGTVKFNWNAWDHMAIEDCIRGSMFNVEYAHINSLGLIDGDIIAGFRYCSKILRIDGDTGDVVWRTGPSVLSREQWKAGETVQLDRGPAPLDFVNDPRGGFSGQHGGHMTPDGNLLVYDNATYCDELPPGVPEGAKGLTQCFERTRAAEYAIDVPNGELVFQREFRMPGTFQGGFGGHAEPLDNGDWVISWSNTFRFGPMPNTSMHVDAETDTPKLTMTLENIIGDRGVGEPHNTRVVMVSPVALAARAEPLTATLLVRSATSSFHTGATDAPTVVVAFSRPVVDFAATTPSVSVTGATVSAVAPHIVAGEPANAYLFTLTPDGDGTITFSLVANQSCATGGMCTADGTELSAVPAAQTIPGPVSVAFPQASVPVVEGGEAAIIIVTMHPAHGRPDDLEIPLMVGATSTAADADFSVPLNVTFGPTETTQTISFMAIEDTIVEAAETVALAFAALPSGVTAGDPATTTVTIAANDPATIALSVDPLTVPEGGTAAVTLAITNGVTFATDQSFPLTFGGSAQAADYTVASNPIILPAGARQATTTMTIVDDAEEEAAEALSVSFSHVGAGTVGDPDTATLTIPANDAPDPVPAIAIGAGPSSPEGSAAMFTLTRTGTPEVLAAALTVDVEVTESGAMLSGTPPTTVTFPPGVGSTSLAVATIDDRVIEAASTVTATLHADAAMPPAYTVADNAGTASIMVTDNDVAEFALTVTPSTVAEGDSAQVTVALTNDVIFTEDQPLVLAFTGSATPTVDYTVQSYSLTLSVGQRSVMTTVTTEDDSAKEPAETIEIAARHESQPVGSTTLTIAASDAPLLTRAVVASGGRTLTLTFQEPLDTQHPPAAAAFTVTADGVAVAATEMEVTEQTVVLHLAGRVSPGQTVTVSYTDPTPADDVAALQTTTGNDADSFTEAAVENQAQSSSRPPVSRPPSGTGGGGGGGGGVAEEEDGDAELVGYLENPGADSFQSGIGVISGWVCAAETVEIVIETESSDTRRLAAAYGTERADTARRADGTRLCGDTDNGFGLLFNWNRLGDGEHTVVALVDGEELGRATVTVTTLGAEFVRDVAGTCVVEAFPSLGETVTLVWQQTSQNFVIADGSAPRGVNRAGTPGVGYLENPGPNAFQSGVGVLSGWVCEAEAVGIEIGHLGRQVAAYGTERLDTEAACGDTDNGFGLLFNWNRLGDGEHEVVALVDGEELGRATVRVTTLGEEFVRGTEGMCEVTDFPMAGQTVTLEWQQNRQNFVITGVD